MKHEPEYQIKLDIKCDEIERKPFGAIMYDDFIKKNIDVLTMSDNHVDDITRRVILNLINTVDDCSGLYKVRKTVFANSVMVGWMDIEIYVSQELSTELKNYAIIHIDTNFKRGDLRDENVSVVDLLQQIIDNTTDIDPTTADTYEIIAKCNTLSTKAINIIKERYGELLVHA